eukprot:CAMPEP_0170359760 /NCGR_PEP_ID=MMETSP0117_2-20130122/2923_1 /TAXON_ID=400756 /ORGANISM="Durinskia baltica, Strain CSIRO CS-38" /LENGTH=206 /DNA_ID=CAMNT_0010614037 /DNA_START=31 /DNA_END=651 /DNA_ORIENTATION=+
MASELAGLFASGALVMVASSMVKSNADDTNADENLPNSALAAESFNKSYGEVTAKKGNILVLSSCFGCTNSPYTALQTAMAKINCPVTMYATETYATVDLRRLLRSNISFVTERRLQAALLAEGLAMCPGEACGLEEPGFFRICLPYVPDAVVTEIVAKVTSVEKKFNSTDKRTATAATETTTKNSNKEGDDEESDDGSTRKRRKN